MTAKVPFVAKLLTILLCLLFAGGVVLLLTIPFLMDYYTRIFLDMYAADPGYQVYIIIFLLAVGSMGLWIIGELIAMMRTIPVDPFVVRNVRAFRRIGIVAAATAGVFFVKTVQYFTILTFVCGLFLIVCSLFAFTLGIVFRQAVVYKAENDLTI
ncbi:MAG: DUF2975 domain-containing protein [Oscillospiraceae bacterium]